VVFVLLEAALPLLGVVLLLLGVVEVVGNAVVVT
jgi:hypothetical protein